jgi:hypothetical protein
LEPSHWFIGRNKKDFRIIFGCGKQLSAPAAAKENAAYFSLPFDGEGWGGGMPLLNCSES